MTAESRLERTYRYERLRAVAAGILETAGTTFLLLIAVRWYQAGAVAKALVAGGGSVGLLLSPIVVSRVTASGWPIAKAAARLLAVGAFSLSLPVVFPVLPIFVLSSVVGMTTSSAVIPLLTQMYQENYPEQGRGRLFARTVMIRIGATALFSDLAGRLLSSRMEYYRWLLLVFAGAFAFGAYCLSRCPSRPLTRAGGSHPFRALRFARDDALFRRTLICWMLMGFANLMMAPLRVEYLANPKYNLALDVSMVAFLNGVVPNMARLVLSPIWGWLFDRTNFFVLRVTLNLGFVIGILSFFTSSNFSGLILGAIVYGISNAGGDVAWSLWVTKFAPPDRVADYMSVHTFFTGVRGLLAPLVAFQLASIFSLGILALFAVALILLACLLLLPEIRLGKAARQAAALVEEISE